METIFSWVVVALGALFVVAVVVAWWEHLVRSSRPAKPPEPTPPRAVSVDVRLDALPPAEPPDVAAAAVQGPPASDAAQRRAALDGAMSRMARAGHDSHAWTETSPMVLHAPGEAPSPDPASGAVPAGRLAPAPAPAATRA